MSRRGRSSLVGALVCAAIALIAPSSANAAFGVEEHNFEAGTCQNKTCTYKSVESNPSEAFTQAAGHPPWGITGFELNSKEAALGQREPEGALKRIRVDVPPGLAADPQALPACPDSQFNTNTCPANTEVGSTELVVFDGVTDLTVTGKVYNMQPRENLPLLFGIDVGVEPLVNVHIFLEGHVAWYGDYHEFFEINNVPREGELLGAKVPLATLKSKLFFSGRADKNNFLTLPSVCSNSTTSYLEVESYAGEVSKTETHTPVGVERCEKVPFAPSAEVKPETAASDVPDGATAIVKVPQQTGEEEINTADVKDAHVTLPEGMTLNPSAAHGLQACTAAQIAIGTTNPVTCPAAAKVGTVTIETDLPPKSLAGNVYLGSPGGGAITGPPYTIYIDAESVYGVSVRLQGQVNPNPATGRLEATFANNPPLPFSELIMTANGGARAPLANPLACGESKTQSLFTPYTGLAAAVSSTPFITSGCPSPLPFSLSQTSQSQPATAGTATSFDFTLARADGQQYVSKVATTLPEGLIGLVPAVARCPEPQASLGSCDAASQIGTATVAAGAGPEPYLFSGPVFFTGPYAGAPYGLSIPVPAVAGPFNLGTVVTRAAISVDPYTARVIVSSSLPTIVGGVPLRLRSIHVSVNRSGFLRNPTGCAPLSADTSLVSTFGAGAALSSPFQVSGCSALPFSPKLTASTKAKTSRAIGAALKTRIVFPNGLQSNVKSVFVQLPKQLPARVSTLNLACREATFNANPYSCPSGAYVGTVAVSTPVLPDRLTGAAVLVSHGGAAFPDLDLLLSGDGVNVILVGQTNIVNNITSSNFASLPDVPVSSVEVKLPQGSKSALGAVGSLCKKPLFMPTTITGQNGKVLKQRTRIAVAGCPRKHKHKHHKRHRRRRHGRAHSRRR